MIHFDVLCRFYDCSEGDKIRAFAVAMQNTAAKWFSTANHFSKWEMLCSAFLRIFGKTSVDCDSIGSQSHLALLDPVEFVAWNLGWFALFKSDATESEKYFRLFEKLPPELKSHFVRFSPEAVNEFIDTLRDLSRIQKYGQMQRRESVVPMGALT